MAVRRIPGSVHAAFNHGSAAESTLAPWLYIGTVVVLLGVAQIVQRRKGKAWEWSFAVVVGFGIAMIAWLVTIGLVNFFAPDQVVPG